MDKPKNAIVTAIQRMSCMSVLQKSQCQNKHPTSITCRGCCRGISPWEKNSACPINPLSGRLNTPTRLHLALQNTVSSSLVPDHLNRVRVKLIVPQRPCDSGPVAECPATNFEWNERGSRNLARAPDGNGEKVRLTVQRRLLGLTSKLPFFITLSCIG